MVFCYQNCSDLLWEKKWSSDWEKLLKYEAEGREFAKILRSLEDYSNSKRSDQFLNQNMYFLHLLLKDPIQSNQNGTIKMPNK